MAKVQFTILVSMIMLCGIRSFSQQQYPITYLWTDSQDSVTNHSRINLKKNFINKDDCNNYIGQLVPQLNAQGYITASVDSVALDSAGAIAKIYIGHQYQWKNIYISDSTQQWLNKINIGKGYFTARNTNYENIVSIQQRMLQYFENNGHPFANIFLDDMQIDDNAVNASLKISTGPLYKIDSIQILGNAKISTDYLQHYLDIKNGSSYSKEKLQNISQLLRQLSYVEEKFPPKLYWTTSGATLQLFIDQKKSSQVNIIIGVLPNNDQLASKKTMITGEALLNLKNALGNGEVIGLNWQRLQVNSQRLNILFQQPYMFRSPFGLDLAFDMFKKDSTFLNLEFRLGTQYALNNQQYVKLFFNQFSTVVSGINENSIIQSRALPEEADVTTRSIGVEYGLNNTNYIFNPVDGFDITFTTTAGNKKIKPNDLILELEDPGDPDFNFASLYDTVKLKTFQIRSQLHVARYFPLGAKRRSTLKTSFNGGYLNSSKIYRNELFQVGGYKLLRGFDEQSQYLSQYALGTVEFRYLIGQNSYFNIFSDGGWGSNTSTPAKTSYTYISGGLGLAFETKFGIFNLAWAVGKRNDADFGLRQSKIHFGFINYF